MAETTMILDAPPQRVFAVLADGWNYADWVVGAVHIRDVDPHWPQPGAKVHHRIGAWPLTIEDTTSVVACEPDRRLALRARLWPLGEAAISVTLVPEGDDQTQATMAEQFANGPLVAVRNRLSDKLLHQRNLESLRRLGDMSRRYR